MKLTLFLATNIVIAALCHITLHAADLPKLEELFRLVTRYDKKLTYIRTGYSNVINGQR